MRRENLLKLWAYISALTVAGAMAALLVFLLYKGLPWLSPRLFFGSTPPLDAIRGARPVWDGIWPAFVGTLYLTGLAMAMALLPGIGCGMYLARFARGRVKTLLTLAVNLMAGVPSIVMGLFGFALILVLRRTIAPDATTCVALAALCMAILVLPALAATTRLAIESLPPSLELTGRALGMSEAQLLRRVLLPAASRGVLGGVMLAMGRAAEDTAVIMLTGVVVNSGLPAGLGAKFEALPFSIYYTAAQYVDADELGRGFGAALVLLALSVGLLLAARALQRRMDHRWKGIR